MKMGLDERAAEHLQQMLKSDVLGCLKIARQTCERWNRENEPWDSKKILSWINGMLTTIGIMIELERARLAGIAAPSLGAMATGEARARLRVVTASPTPDDVD